MTINSFNSFNSINFYINHYNNWEIRSSFVLDTIYKLAKKYLLSNVYSRLSIIRSRWDLSNDQEFELLSGWKYQDGKKQLELLSYEKICHTYDNNSIVIGNMKLHFYTIGRVELRMVVHSWLVFPNFLLRITECT